MFLATTAIEDFWDTSREILFLGEWCKLYSRRRFWSRFESRTVPYHWLDREKLARDYVYLDRVYEHYLRLLSDRLNEAHRTDHSLQYWRIVVGWWLRCFIEILFDRYESLRKAQAEFEVDSAWTLPQNTRHDFAPENFSEFQTFLAGDLYNLFLFSRIIQRLGCFPYEEKETDLSGFLSKHPSGAGAGHRNLKQNLINALATSGKFMPDGLRDIAFVNSYFDVSQLAKLQLGLGQYPSLDLEPSVPDQPRVPLNVNQRENLDILTSEDEFTHLLALSLGENLPKVYLESYKNSNVDAARFFPAQPRVIFTAVSHLSNDLFKLWAAQCVERGSKLAIEQHGGHRGSGLFNSPLDHELQIADTYYSWGWQSSATRCTVKTLPASKLISLANGSGRTAGGQKVANFYMNLSSYPRYSLYLYSVPFGAVWLQSIEFQAAFLLALPPAIRRDLVCRPYMIDYGWDEVERLTDRVPEVNLAASGGSWHACLATADLVIETNNQTTLLESLAADVPTVLILQPEFWEMTPEAEEYLNQLHKAGIYFNEIEAAAAHVNEIHKNPWDWWRQPHVQEAKNEFRNRYAYTREDWLSLWKSELQSLRRTARSFKAAA